MASSSELSFLSSASPAFDFRGEDAAFDLPAEDPADLLAEDFLPFADFSFFPFCADLLAGRLRLKGSWLSLSGDGDFPFFSSFFTFFD